MSQQTLTVSRESDIMYVGFNNPPVNLMSKRMVQELFELVGMLNMDPSVKVVVFESSDPDFFIAHFDLNDLVNAANDPASAGKFNDINILQSLALSIQALPQVSIAKVNGACRGAGLEIILGMTMRFASERSRFCAPEASSGFLACGGGSTRLALTCGPARALEIMLSARDFSGQEAQEYGIVNRTLPEAELDSYVRSLAEKIAMRSSQAIAVNREVIKTVFEGMVEPMFAGLAYENDAMRQCMANPAVAHSIQSMLALGQKRESELELPDVIERMVKTSPKS